MKKQIVVVLGPTATGKSDFAVEIAKKVGGEIISADSRQVYKGLDIGSGKVPRDKTKSKSQVASSYLYRGVPHHLLDVASPKKVFTVAQYKKLADKKIKEIISRGKIPIIVGGTGFYIDAIINDILFPEVKPDAILRKELSKKNTEELFLMLKKLDPRRAKEIDAKNPVRLIRAIEIAKSIGKTPKLRIEQKYEPIFLGLDFPDEELKERINKRLMSRLKQGMLKEASNLHENGLSWRRMEQLGLEYRYMAKHLKGELSREEMIESLKSEIWKYAKRQRTWFKRNKEIVWVR